MAAGRAPFCKVPLRNSNSTQTPATYSRSEMQFTHLVNYLCSTSV